ncbi:LytTR family DNA-binding domain-containing protein [Arcicella sp. LKC2W]|uniref:LytR/AlgR family response regulator transcription factor n=1 Tax=Arcicella sp. LKC2W TaxID=2984198 RepID=UPI002B204F01|nr:LytTR family DNA-binding domain-containing protein [Arcicella sp. LKC2W]MEA5459910.1 LytTR family DNA-binding domain-containing protein [Arcicella sp. LKC2W]
MQTATTNLFGNPYVLGKRTILFANEVLYFEGDINYTYIHLVSGKQKLLSKTLLFIENQVDSEKFIRISRKHLVNKKFVLKSGRSFVVLINGDILPVSRRRRGILR